MTLPILLKLVAACHLGLIAAGALMPRTVDLWRHVIGLPLFVRQLFKVYYVFIGFILVSFGSLTWIFAEELAGGTPLAKAMCGLMAGFWLLRLLVAVFVFDVRPYLSNWFYRAGYMATNVVFATLPLAYVWVGLRGGAQ